jgi:hypothetical protein
MVVASRGSLWDIMGKYGRQWNLIVKQWEKPVSYNAGATYSKIHSNGKKCFFAYA